MTVTRLLRTLQPLALALLAGCSNEDGVRSRKPDGQEATVDTQEHVEAYVKMLKVSADAPVFYRLGSRETKNLDELGTWLAQVQERAAAARVPVAARIYASNLTPHAEVAKVLEKFKALGVPRVEYFREPSR